RHGHGKAERFHGRGRKRRARQLLMSNRPAVPRRASGFTLVEMIVTIVIGAIVFGIGGMVISNGFRTYFAGGGIASDDWQGRLALERMTRDLRNVRSTADLTTILGSNIAFTDINGNTISYQLAGTTLNRIQNGVTQPLADGIGGLTFTYTRSDGG